MKTAIKRLVAVVSAMALIFVSWMIVVASDGMEPDDDEVKSVLTS